MGSRRVLIDPRTEETLIMRGVWGDLERSRARVETVTAALVVFVWKLWASCWESV